MFIGKNGPRKRDDEIRREENGGHQSFHRAIVFDSKGNCDNANVLN
jgi:hypothetical protein